MRLVKETDSSIDQLFIWYMLFGMLMLVGGLDFLFAGGGGGDSSSNPKRLLSLLMVYMVSLGFLFLFPSKRAFDIAFHPLVLLVILLPLISISWSSQPSLSGKRAIAHALTVVFVLTVASRVTIEEFFRAFLLVLAATGVVSLLVVIGMPSTGVTPAGPNTGAWRAGFGHKAGLGRICAMALAIAIFIPAKDKEMRYAKWISIVTFGLLISMSQSRIAWGTLGIALLAAMVFKVMRWQRLDGSVRAIIFLTLGGTVLVGLALAFEQVIYASGRDMTFSGRTSLWSSAISVASIRHPFEGAGYGAFWTRSSSIEVLRYMQHWGQMPNHGHNGYLDAWLEMGWIGVGTLVGVTIVALFTILRRLNDKVYGDYWFLLLILHVQFLTINIGGTISFKHSEIFWILFLAPLLFRLQRPQTYSAPAPRPRMTGARLPRPDRYIPQHLRRPLRQD